MKHGLVAIIEMLLYIILASFHRQKSLHIKYKREKS